MRCIGTRGPGGSVKVILQDMCGVPENLKEPENLEISKKN